jgi:hypothetical protein
LDATQHLRCGELMIAAKKVSGKSNPEMFDDVPVLQRKWHAALRPGERLPRYEEVMLGSLGRLADHVVLLKHNDEGLEVSRTGRYVQKWLGDDRWDIPLSALSPDCATALGEAAASALRNGRPYLGVAHCVRDGLVQTYDILALPTSSRWGGTLIGAYVNEGAPQYNLLEADFFHHRRRRAVACDDSRFKRAAIRFPDRPSQSGRLPAPETAINRIAVAPAQCGRQSALFAGSDRTIACCGHERPPRPVRNR